MLPTLTLPWSGIAIQSHDLLVAAAALGAALIGYHGLTAGERLEARRVQVALLLIAIVTFAGGRLHFVLANWGRFGGTPWRALTLSGGALHAPGAILGAALGTLVVVPGLGLPLGRFADGLAPAVGVGIAIARLGCFLHGCCFGSLCPYPWGVALPGTSFVALRQSEAGLLATDAARALPVHPLPLYFAAAGLGITAVLLWRRPRKRFDGELALLLVLLFAASSAVLESWRADDPGRVYWGPLPQLMWVNAILAGVAAVGLAAAQRRAA